VEEKLQGGEQSIRGMPEGVVLPKEESFLY